MFGKKKVTLTTLELDSQLNEAYRKGMKAGLDLYQDERKELERSIDKGIEAAFTNLAQDIKHGRIGLRLEQRINYLLANKRDSENDAKSIVLKTIRSGLKTSEVRPRLYPGESVIPKTGSLLNGLKASSIIFDEAAEKFKDLNKPEIKNPKLSRSQRRRRNKQIRNAKAAGEKLADEIIKDIPSLLSALFAGSEKEAMERCGCRGCKEELKAKYGEKSTSSSNYPERFGDN